MGNINPFLLCDFYKISHREQYPKETQHVYATWIPRCARIKVDKVIFFGLQYFIKKYLIEYFNDNFFNKEFDVSDYKRVISKSLGQPNVDISHLEKLHKLGYLPLEIRALPEGSKVGIGTPMFSIENTHPDFFWLTNFIETLLSNSIWLSCTNATIANEYRLILEKYANETSDSIDFVKFQGHDFSMRGMSSLESSMISGGAHLTSFVGTDTIPAIPWLEKYYNANIDNELVGTSIPATEHSVMCAGGKGNEFQTYKRLITEVYPNGFVSIVSDTWNLWNVLDEIIASLKNDILNREGRVVIRPDSGDPVKILCGDKEAKTEQERKGVVEILWDIFGGTLSSTGYKMLDPHIGCIYGDAITLERCYNICEQLKQKGFASTNVVYGIGSYTYQYNTRDTFGFALKTSNVVIDGMDTPVYKDPYTDKDKFKKSLIGRHPIKDIVFKDGKLLIDHSLSEIKNRIKE